MYIARLSYSVLLEMHWWLMFIRLAFDHFGLALTPYTGLTDCPQDVNFRCQVVLDNTFGVCELSIRQAALPRKGAR